MKYKLKDICTITKGAIGIMKAIPGKYPLVALSDERRSHNEFQFDAKAVIVPLISSTGHGHASMKRVHYQEGKFALGNILCAVIPRDEEKLNAKYLHLYLQQFKETLLVPLMKGAANVSLPMNKLAEVEIEVPSLQKQVEIISLAEEASEYKDLLDEKLALQSTDVIKLRQAFLKEAMLGLLVKQNTVEETVDDLLKKIEKEKEVLVKKKQAKPYIKVDISYQIPSNWKLCKLEDLCLKIHYGFNASAKPEKKEVRLLRITDIQNSKVEWERVPGCNYSKSDLKNYLLNENDILIARTGGTIGKTFLVKNIPVKSLFASYLIRVVPSKNISPEFLKFFMESSIYWKQLHDAAWGAGQPNVNGTSLSNLIVPVPTFSEQQSIVKKLTKLMSICDDLQYRIQQSKSENEKLLQAVLIDALKSPSNIYEMSPTLELEENYFAKRKILANYIINQSLQDEKFGDVKFEKLLHLCEYHGIKRNLNQKYFKKAAGPFDNKFTFSYFQQIEKGKLFIRKKVGQQYVFKKGEKHSASEKYYNYFSDEEFKKIDKIINYFKTSSYEPAEIVSTLYAVWNDRIIAGKDISDELLIKDFYNWDTSKKRYKEDRLHIALDWMRENEFVPDGWGNIIEKKVS